MQRDEIRQNLNQVFRSVFGQPSLSVRDNMTASEVRNWDSMNHVTMIFAAEKKFGVKFSTREVQELHNVGELISLIEKKSS